jgi:hypothetical protein
MNRKTLDVAIAEAERFLERAKKLKVCEPSSHNYFYSSPKEQGATRRASLDLTRALAEMRKP